MNNTYRLMRCMINDNVIMLDLYDDKNKDNVEIRQMMHGHKLITRSYYKAVCKYHIDTGTKGTLSQWIYFIKSYIK